MKYRCIVLKSEIDFYKYIIMNYNLVDRIFVFEDTLDNIIFFYAILQDNTFIGAKEVANNNYLNYYEKYMSLDLPVEFSSVEDKILKLKRSHI